MGALILDSGVLVGALDGEDAHHQASRAALSPDARRRVELIVPASVYAEVLVHPFRRGSEAVAAVDRFIRLLPAGVAPVTAGVARLAARLRAEHRTLRLADAIVLATAIDRQASVLTTDSRWPVVHSVDVTILSPRLPGGS